MKQQTTNNKQQATSNKQRYPLTGIERHSRLFFLAALFLLSPLVSSAVEQVAPLTAPVYQRISGATMLVFPSVQAMQAESDAAHGGAYVSFSMTPGTYNGIFSPGRGVATGRIWPPNGLPLYGPGGTFLYYIFVVPPACPVPVLGSPYTFNPQSGMCERPCPDPATGAPCLCETVYELGVPRNSCVVGRQEQYTLTLSPASATIEPDKTYPFTATVTKQGGGAPDIPVPVSVKVDVDPISGGHAHGEDYAARNKGSVSPAAGSTTLSITFGATEISGTHTITATCDMCVNKTATATVTVKVPGLVPIPGSEFYTFIGGEAGKPHHDNHYLTAEATSVLRSMAESYRMGEKFRQLRIQRMRMWRWGWNQFVFVPPPPLHLNDASLVWGGRFDANGNWADPHAGHRRGVVIDVRANLASGAIPLASFADFKKMAATYYGANAQVHCTSNKRDGQNRKPPACIGKDGSQDNNRHFHILLLGVDQ